MDFNHGAPALPASFVVHNALAEATAVAPAIAGLVVEKAGIVAAVVGNDVGNVDVDFASLRPASKIDVPIGPSLLADSKVLVSKGDLRVTKASHHVDFPNGRDGL